MVGCCRQRAHVQLLLQLLVMVLQQARAPDSPLERGLRQVTGQLRRCPAALLDPAAQCGLAARSVQMVLLSHLSLQCAALRRHPVAAEGHAQKQHPVNSSGTPLPCLAV